jgi:hypothetical protein
MFTFLAAFLVGTFAFMGTSYASNVMQGTVENPLDYVRPLYDAIVSGNYWLAAALALIVVVALARRYIAPHVPFLQTKLGIALMVLFGSFGGALATAITAGATPGFALVYPALAIAATAAGGYTLLKELLAPVLEKLKAKSPKWLHPVFDLVLWVFTTKERVKEAGDAAVKKNPPSGTAGIVGNPRDIL